MTLARYLVGVLIVVSMPPAILWWFLVHPFIGFWRRMGVRAAITTVTVLVVALLVALVPLRDALVGRDLGTSWPLVGLACVLYGGCLYIAVHRKRHLTLRILAGAPEIAGDGGTLLTEGPYAVVRHPRYIEVALGVLGYAAFANHSGSWIVALLTLPTLHGVVLLEERELAERFGPVYEAYRARVPRYVPRLGARKSTSTTSQRGR